MRSLFLLSFVLVGFSVSAQRVNRKLTMCSALLGKWEMAGKSGVVVEEWRRASASELRGKSYRINAGDTTLLETIIIRSEGDEVFYIPTVSNQNDGKPVRFKLAGAEAGKLVFENALHDFPQRIVYWPKAKNDLVAWIEGQKNGSYSKREFVYRRVK